MGGPIYFFSSYKMLNNIFYNNANYVHNAFCDSNYTQIADISTNKTVSAWGKTISHALFYSLFEYYMINRFQILNIQIVYLVLGLTYVLVAFSDDMQKGRTVFKEAVISLKINLNEWPLLSLASHDIQITYQCLF